MIRKDTEDMVVFLNNLLATDRLFVQDLLAVRHPCKRELADHPTVQVVSDKDGEKYCHAGEFRCGVLGVLNGYFGSFDDGPREGWGPISAVYDEGLLQRFEITKNAEET